MGIFWDIDDEPRPPADLHEVTAGRYTAFVTTGDEARADDVRLCVRDEGYGTLVDVDADTDAGPFTDEEAHLVEWANRAHEPGCPLLLEDSPRAGEDLVVWDGCRRVVIPWRERARYSKGFSLVDGAGCEREFYAPAGWVINVDAVAPARTERPFPTTLSWRTALASAGLSGRTVLGHEGPIGPIPVPDAGPGMPPGYGFRTNRTNCPKGSWYYRTELDLPVGGTLVWNHYVPGVRDRHLRDVPVAEDAARYAWQHYLSATEVTS